MTTEMQRQLDQGRHPKLVDNIKARLPEWICAGVTLLYGIALAILPLVPGSRIPPALSYGPLGESIPLWGWAAFAILLGSGRIVVLVINGRWRRSPHSRYLLAAANIFLWTQIVFGILAGQWSTGLAVYPLLLVLDLWTTRTTSVEARIRDTVAAIVVRGDGTV